jgi:hypothetical protein
MKFMFKISLLLNVLFVFSLHRSLGQSNHVIPSRDNQINENAWLVQVSTIKIANKWDLLTDIQWRQSELGTKPMQLLLRPAIQYRFYDKVSAALGYLYCITHSYGKIPQTIYSFPEHRLWQQFIISNKIGIIEAQQRIRFENRWIGEVSNDMKVSKYRYQNRLRYLYRLQLPINGSKIEKGKFYLHFYDEIMIGFGKNVGANIYDQNRLYLGLGFHTGVWGKIEIGYLYQHLMHRREKIVYQNVAKPTSTQFFENNHTVTVSYFLNLDISKKSD